MSEINIQLFGPDCPPLYDEKTVLELNEDILKIDEKMNELAIKRESLVTALRKKVKETDNI